MAQDLTPSEAASSEHPVLSRGGAADVRMHLCVCAFMKWFYITIVVVVSFMISYGNVSL